MSVTSELISLPPAAVVALAEVVPPRVAGCLATPGAFDLPPEEWPDQRPAGCSLVSSDEWLRLLRRMLTCGMVTIRAEEELLQWGSRVVTAGVFAVPKPGDKQRLIVDRRWGNSMEKNLMTVLAETVTCTSEEFRQAQRMIRLPGPNMFGEIIMGPKDRLSIQLDDLRDYYYLLRWPDHMTRSGAVGPA